MQKIIQDFTQTIEPSWRQHMVGNGVLTQATTGLRLANRPTLAATYTNAQIDDYQGLSRRNFLWRPPLRLTVRACFSHAADQLRGTAGFGFWNDPFLMTGVRRPSLPRALWFFYSAPPSNIQLALDVPGCGWKAATIDAWRWPFFLLVPSAPVAMPLMRIRPLYRALWPLAQRAIGVSEALLKVSMTNWHTYTIEWGMTTARFFVDEQLVLLCPTPPRGPLGLVIWKDTQAMVITPWGQFRHMAVAVDETQWLEIAGLTIEAGQS